VTDYPTIPLEDYREYPVEEMRERVEAFYTDINRRRTVREFSDRPVPRDIIETRSGSFTSIVRRPNGLPPSNPSARTPTNRSWKRRRTWWLFSCRNTVTSRTAAR
jgi:hypothetical protein